RGCTDLGTKQEHARGQPCPHVGSRHFWGPSVLIRVFDVRLAADDLFSIRCYCTNPRHDGERPAQDTVLDPSLAVTPTGMEIAPRWGCRENESIIQVVHQALRVSSFTGS